MHNLLFWQYNTSLTERFWVAAVLIAAGWLVMLLRLRRRSGVLLIAAILAIALGLTNAGLVVWQLENEARHPPAVVVAGEHTLRLGRGEAYEPALAEPLGPGVELRILNERGEWFEIRLPGGQSGWLPAEAVERV